MSWKLILSMVVLIMARLTGPTQPAATAAEGDPMNQVEMVVESGRSKE